MLFFTANRNYLNGVYIIELKDGDVVSRKKIVKNNAG